MKQIIFYWVGKNLDLPNYLVKTIKLIHKGEIKIIQLTDKETQKIKQIDEILRIDATKNIMIDRLEAYSLIETKQNTSLFLDADCLLLNKLDFEKYDPGIYLTKRITNLLINFNSPEFYPEFKGKRFNEVMPFLFSAILIVNNENPFKKLIKILTKLPIRFHRWYGDQFALKILYDQKEIDFNFLEKNFIFNLEFDGKTKNIDLNISKKNSVLHFKVITKNYVGVIFKKLTNL